MRRRIILGLLSIAVSACSSIYTKDPKFGNYHKGEPYSGVRHNMQLWQLLTLPPLPIGIAMCPGLCILLTADLAASAAWDTILLPFDLLAQQNKSNTVTGTSSPDGKQAENSRPLAFKPLPEEGFTLPK